MCWVKGLNLLPLLSFVTPAIRNIISKAKFVKEIYLYDNKQVLNLLWNLLNNSNIIFIFTGRVRIMIIKRF